MINNNKKNYHELKNYYRIKDNNHVEQKKANKIYNISRKFLKLESDVAPFNVLGNLLKRIEPEYLKVFFPRLNLGAGKWRWFLFLVF